MATCERGANWLRDSLSRQPAPQLNPVERQPASDQVVANLENTLFGSLAPQVGHSISVSPSSILRRASNRRPHLWHSYSYSGISFPSFIDSSGLLSASNLPRVCDFYLWSRSPVWALLCMPRVGSEAPLSSRRTLMRALTTPNEVCHADCSTAVRLSSDDTGRQPDGREQPRHTD